MSLASNARAMVRRRGETMVLSRDGEGTTITLKGKRVGGTTEETGNSAAQQRFRVRIDPTNIEASAWASKVARRTDRLEFGGRKHTVLDARALKDGDALALYELDVAG